MKRKLLLLSIPFFIGLFLLIFFFFPRLEQEEKKIYQVGALLSGPERLEKIKGLIDGLKDLGMVEGSEYRLYLWDAGNDPEKMKAYAGELDKRGLDLIVTGGAIEAQAFAGQKGGKTPILFMGVADAARLQLIDRYERPGGRFTGLENGHIDLSVKRLQLLKLLLPSTSRVIILYDQRIDASRLSLTQVTQYAKESEIPILPFTLSGEDEVAQLKAFSPKKGDAFLLLPSYYLEEISGRLAQIALDKKVPLFGLYENDVTSGFLLSYGIPYYDQGYQSAHMASALLHGQDPATLPVETPDTVRLLVNPDTEKRLGITFSPAGEAYAERIMPDREKGGE